MAKDIQPKIGNTLSIYLYQDFILDWTNQFYQAKRSEGISSYTLTFYKQQLNHFLRCGNTQVITRISEITPNLIRQFLLWHKETGHNPGGLYGAFRVLKTFLLWYEDEVEPDDWKNPIHKIKAPKIPENILGPVDMKDVHSQVDTCKATELIDSRDKAILLFYWTQVLGLENY